jgi:hypothetical protein
MKAEKEKLEEELADSIKKPKGLAGENRYVAPALVAPVVK